MKKLVMVSLMVLSVWFSLPMSSNASFSIPSDAYRMHELEAALETAKSDGWALTFLLAAEETPCPIGTQASIDAIQQLEPNSIIVYVNAFQNELDQCPSIIKRAFSSRKAGRTLPIAVILDSHAKKVLDVIPFDRDRDAYLETLRAASEKMKDRSSSLFDKLSDLF